MINYKFAIFILSYNRSEKVYTYDALKKSNYTGDIYIIIDNLDPEINNYKKIYKDKVLVFDKIKESIYTDSMDNQKKYNSVVFARNYNFKIAKELGLDYFLQLDDDYTNFGFAFNKNMDYIGQKRIKNFDAVCNIFINFLKIKNVKCISFAQSGDYIGGVRHLVKKYLNGEIPRKIMNSFFFKTSAPVNFIGRINEDVNLYVSNGNKGDFFCTNPFVRLQQIETQQNTGGLTDIYLDLGTYVKSFYTVMISPSCIKIYTMGINEKRIHHKINWNYAVPKLISEKHKK